MPPDCNPLSPLLAHDGTSQAGRKQLALDPDYVSVDERSPQDLLKFAQAYAKSLKYFDENNLEAGDWSTFLPDRLDPDHVVNYMTAPEKFAPVQAGSLNRPHLVLFLAFLQLFRLAQQRLNTLTRRHLDFYYRQVLGMTRKQAMPDRVNVLIVPAAGIDQAKLPAGTMLAAGRDSLGLDRSYRTDQDVVVNRAQVARLSSLYVSKRITGIREARELDPGPQDEAIFKMLRIALGQPFPGDPLPLYPSGAKVDQPLKENVNIQVLSRLRDRLDFVKKGLYLKFYLFRDLMKRKRNLDHSSEYKNAEINRLKGKASNADNLNKAMDGKLDFGTLPEVKNINDLYDHRGRQDVQAFIRDTLHFANPSDFERLMRIKVQVDYEWDEINRILETAGQGKKGPDFHLAIKDPTDFPANLKNAIDVPPIPEFDDIDHYYDAVLQVERYFGLTAEKCHTLLSVITQPKPVATQNDWDWVYKILAESYRERIYEGRRQELKSKREAPKENKGGFTGMIDYALSKSLATAEVSPLLRLKAFVRDPKDYAFLESLKPKPTFLTASNGIKVTCTADPSSVTIAEVGPPGKIDFKVGQDTQSKPTLTINVEVGGSDVANLLDAWEDWKKQPTNQPPGFEIVRVGTGSAKVTAAPNQPLTIPKDLVDSLDATADEWDRVYGIVEIAQRICEAFPEPVAQTVKWLNAYPAVDATAVKVAQAIETAGLVRWKTFGAVSNETRDSSPPPVFGWAIRSPLLELSQGKRTITLTLGFAQKSFEDKVVRDALTSADPPFQLQVSTEKGWREPETLPTGTPGDYQTLSKVAGPLDLPLSAIQFQPTFGVDVDPIAPPKPADGETASPWPVLRLMLHPARNADVNQYVAPYTAFTNLVLKRVHLRVEVDRDQSGSGLTNFQAQNDDAMIDPTKPFEPFGSSPSAGSRFFIAHPELVHKRLDSLNFRFEWMGVPANLATYYANYDAVKDGKFTTSISLVDRKVERTLSRNASLFADPTQAAAVQTITVADLPAALKLDNPNYVYQRNLTVEMGDVILAWDRYVQWRLDAPDFQHHAYPTVSASKSLQLAWAMAAVAKASTAADDAAKAADAATTDADKTKVKDTTDAVLQAKADALKYQVNPPYTPKIKSLSLGYSASVELVMDQYRRGVQTDQVLHVHPFGLNEILPELDGDQYAFLPLYDSEGELYVGISDLHPPQSVSLLFQMAEGSADPDLEVVPIRWSYLSADSWVDMDRNKILLDTTRGLITSGIIVFNLPAVGPSTRLPGNLSWIRCLIPATPTASATPSPSTPRPSRRRSLTTGTTQPTTASPCLATASSALSIRCPRSPASGSRTPRSTARCRKRTRSSTLA